MIRYIFITGGVVSSLGKGIASAAMGALLQARGYDVGKIDGILGAGTRSAVRDVQRELGLPADAWPTPELLARLAR